MGSPRNLWPWHNNAVVLPLGYTLLIWRAVIMLGAIPTLLLAPVTLGSWSLWVLCALQAGALDFGVCTAIVGVCSLAGEVDAKTRAYLVWWLSAGLLPWSDDAR